MTPFSIPMPSDIAPIRGTMTEAQRSAAIAHVLAECGENLSPVVVVETVLRLKLSHVELGPGLWAAVDEARAELMEAVK